MRFLRAISPGLGWLAGVIAFDGDSLVSGQGVNPWQRWTDVATASLLAQGLTLADAFNKGIPAQTVATMIVTAPTNIDPLLRTAQGVLVPRLFPAGFGNICSADGGINDIVLGGVNAATMIARLKTYWNARQAAGWRCVPTTITPDGAAPGSQATIDAVNVDMRANLSQYGGAVALSDFAAVPQAQNPADATFYQPDQLHYTAALDAILGPVAAAAIRTTILA